MKKLAVVLIALGALSGCVVHPVGAHRHGGYHDHDRDRGSYRGHRDRDRDGVPNRYDRRPDNPRRY